MDKVEHDAGFRETPRSAAYAAAEVAEEVELFVEAVEDALRTYAGRLEAGTR